MLFIRRAQERGFTLAEVRALLLVSDAPESLPAEQLEAVVTAKLGELDRRVADLVRMRDALAELARTGPVHPRCPVIDALA